ncbi:MAG: ribosome recycling factor [Ruminococcaceae bacterium]|nr:ribosome recycling factor [Oscillospiraceae bacterium]
MKLETKEYERKMTKSIDVFKDNLAVIRAGRANAAVLGNLSVEYYGAETPITQMGEVKVTDPKTLVIQPWDASTLKSIEKAILASDIGITPQNDGKVIRLVFPQLTEERRKEIKKNIAKLSEDAKVNIRNIRRDANDTSKNMKKNGEMTEDEQKASDKAIQDLTDKYIKEVEAVTADKEKEIMSI